MLPSLRAASVLLALGVAWTMPALAQTPPTLTPPVVQSNTDVPYPPNVVGDAVVELELLVDKSGAVARATVLAGAEPFAEQARLAVLNWHFSPALRGDTPVVARIRAQVHFRQDS